MQIQLGGICQTPGGVHADVTASHRLRRRSCGKRPSGLLAQLRRERQAHLERVEGVMSVPVETRGGEGREPGWQGGSLGGELTGATPGPRKGSWRDSHRVSPFIGSHPPTFTREETAKHHSLVPTLRSVGARDTQTGWPLQLNRGFPILASDLEFHATVFLPLANLQVHHPRHAKDTDLTGQQHIRAKGRRWVLVPSGRMF